MRNKHKYQEKKSFFPGCLGLVGIVLIIFVTLMFIGARSGSELGEVKDVSAKIVVKEEPVMQNKRITKDMYSRIKTGMSCQEVFTILGEGEELSRSEIAGHTTVMYQWQNWGGPNMSVTLQNDAVTMKAQYGLK